MEHNTAAITGAIESFKKDHGGKPPKPLRMWEMLHHKSDSAELGDAPPTGTSCGPYMYGWPVVNQLNGWSDVADKPAPGVAWVYTVSGTNFKFSGVNATGTAVLSEDEAHLYYFRPDERAYVLSQRAWNNCGGLVFAIPLMLYLPAFYLFHHIRRARRIALGLCETCCYDLRASKDRCPECGTPFFRGETDRKDNESNPPSPLSTVLQAAPNPSRSP